MAAAGWFLLKESDEIFIGLNGQKMVNRAGKPFGKVIGIGTTTKTGNVEISFMGDEKRNLQLSLLQENDVSVGLDTTSPSAFVKSSVKKFSWGRHTRKRKITTVLDPSSASDVAVEQVEQVQQVEQVEQGMDDTITSKYLGIFEVTLNQLVEFDVQYQRKKCPIFIRDLQKDVKQVFTIFPACITVENPKDVTNQWLKDKQVMSLGANQLLEALKQSHEIRNLHVHLYANISVEEARKLATDYQRQSHNVKDLSFQDKVDIAKKLPTISYQLLQDHLLALTGKKYKKNGLSTIINVANYGEDEFAAFKRYCASVEPKSVKTKLMKLLHGVPQETRITVLDEAANSGQTQAIETLQHIREAVQENHEAESALIEGSDTEGEQETVQEEEIVMEGSETQDPREGVIRIRVWHEGREITTIPAIAEILSSMKDDILEVVEMGDPSRVPTQDLFKFSE